MRHKFWFLLVLLLISLPLLCSAEDALPKNAKLEIRLEQTLGSDTSQIGQPFSATLSRAISGGEKTIVPKGAHIEGVVEDAAPTLNYSRPGSLGLSLKSVTASGKIIRLSTNTLYFQGKERQINPTTGRQDDRGARAEDAARAGIGVAGAGSTSTSHTIPGTALSVGAASPVTGMQVILPAKTKLTFSIVSAD
jgi:hypothetical protein